MCVVSSILTELQTIFDSVFAIRIFMGSIFGVYFWAWYWQSYYETTANQKIIKIRVRVYKECIWNLQL